MVILVCNPSTQEAQIFELEVSLVYISNSRPLGLYIETLSLKQKQTKNM